VNLGQKLLDNPHSKLNHMPNMSSTHILMINDHRNSIQALGKAVEKGAMFE